MSFAAEVKNELCRTAPGHLCCARAEAYGVLLFCNVCSPDEIRIVTENETFARRLPRLFYKAFGVHFDKEPEADGKAGKYTFQITEADKLSRIMDTLGYDRLKSLAMHINLALLEEEHCRAAFLRGAFLAGGSMIDPGKSYHMELATNHFHASRELETLLREMELQPKSVQRSGYYVIYFKQSEAIEELLTRIGAPLAAMELMNTKLEKDLRNQVNRKLNCDTANLDKSVEAATHQVELIRRMAQFGVIDRLSEKLKETAAKRLLFPELTLSELAAEFSPPLTKSCLNHRLRKLMEIAEQMEGKKNDR